MTWGRSTKPQTAHIRPLLKKTVFLDLSATFDTIDHQASLQRLKALYGINGVAINWLPSYISNRQQSVAIDGGLSAPAALGFGVPQGSALGPKLYTMYTKPLGSLLADHGLDYHMYADDTQEYVSFDIRQPDQQSDAIQKMECCLNDVCQWMSQNMLILNCEKTSHTVCTQKF